MNQAQVAKANQIADFLRRRVTFVQNANDYPWSRPYAGWQTLPTSEQFAKDLLADTEFRSFQLGTWLGTTDGEVITTAVRMVIPPIYQPEFDLAVDALKLAARMQQQEGQKVALSIVGARIIGAGLIYAGRSAA